MIMADDLKSISDETNNYNAVELSQQTAKTDIGSRSGQHNSWVGHASHKLEKSDGNKSLFERPGFSELGTHDQK